MKVSYNWLCELLPGLKKYPPQEVAKKLTHAGLEVESVTDQAAKYKGIVVGEVVSKEKHPNAEKLSLCRVRADKEYQVVCGAPNVTAGKKYPFATIGTVMPGGLEIKPIKLRGAESCGMLCSAKELELSDEQEGILEIDFDLKTNQAISEALHLNDVILEVNVTPNRGDALSHWGLCCDIAALTGLKVHRENLAPAHVNLPKIKKSAKKPGLKITHRDKKSCGRFTGSEIFGVTVAKSPAWLVRRLESLGIRAINNVVDITNYVMLLTGHPVHAYDAEKIFDHELIIESCQTKFKFKTLDDVERELVPGDLVIADGKGLVGLAGIMGGENSGIGNATKDLILEVAFFDPDKIRATAKRLGLQSESSYRFERYVNPESVLQAHEILCQLILSICGGEATTIRDSYPRARKPVKIKLMSSEIERILGIEIPAKEVKKILAGLNCLVKVKKHFFDVTVPSARSDLSRPIDLIEEVSRLYGLDKIPSEMPALTLRSAKESGVSRIERELKEYFVQQGFHETVHYSFGERDFFQTVLNSNGEDWIELKNAISQDMSVMRPSLLPHLLRCYSKNRLLSEKGIRLFELRNVYKKDSANKIMETKIFACLYSGNAFGRNRFGLNRESDFFDGKGLLEGFFEKARVCLKGECFENWPFHPGQAFVYKHNGESVAMLGALHPKILQLCKISEKIYYMEVILKKLASLYQKQPINYCAVNPLPSVYRDLALVVPSDMPFQQILDVLEKEKPKNLIQVDLFDVYEGRNLPVDKKSIAFSMSYEAEGESLTDEQVNAVHFALVEKLQKILDVTLR